MRTPPPSRTTAMQTHLMAPVLLLPRDQTHHHHHHQTRPCFSSMAAYLTQLPPELFLCVAVCLAPADICRLRRVSRAWRSALSAPDTCRALLQHHFPRCREVRRQQRSLHGDDDDDGDAAFATVARRYHGLGRGQPRRVEQLDRQVVSVCSDWLRPRKKKEERRNKTGR